MSLASFEPATSDRKRSEMSHISRVILQVPVQSKRLGVGWFAYVKAKKEIAELLSITLMTGLNNDARDLKVTQQGPSDRVLPTD